MQLKKKRIAVLVSGGGTGLQTIIDGCASGYIPAEICLVLSSAKKAYAIERAKKAGIPTAIIAKRDYPDEDACQAARHEAITAAAPDFIVLSGYLGIVPAKTVSEYKNRIINIHPALIPSFNGRGMYGLHVHQAALDYGVKVTGVTIHIVDEGVDTGPIMLQEAVPVMDNDTAEVLQQRVMLTEHRLLPLAVKLMAEDRVMIEGRKVKIIQEREEKL